MRTILPFLAAVSYMAVFFAARKFVANEKIKGFVQRAMLVIAVAAVIVVFAIGVVADARINEHTRVILIFVNIGLLVLALRAPSKRSAVRIETRRGI